MLLANDRKLDRPVALKLVGAGLESPADQDRFNREIRLTARLVHPNIVPLFDSGRAGDQLFYVMPFIDGETLRDRLNRLGPRPEAEVERVLHDLAEALAYAHASGVVHRDLKPENIFWYGGRALLADFGIASVMHGTASETAAHRTQGIRRHGELHEPGAGRRRRPRWPLGSLQPRVRGLRTARDEAALPARLVRGHAGRPRDGRGAPSRGRTARDQRDAREPPSASCSPDRAIDGRRRQPRCSTCWAHRREHRRLLSPWPHRSLVGRCPIRRRRHHRGQAALGGRAAVRRGSRAVRALPARRRRRRPQRTRDGEGLLRAGAAEGSRTAPRPAPDWPTSCT